MSIKRMLGWLVLAAQLSLAAPSVAQVQEPGWPRELASGQARMTYYEPQVDSWKNFTDLAFRMAFELRQGGGQPVVGIAVIQARTDVNVDRRTVAITQLRVASTRFPSLDAAAARPMDALARQLIAEPRNIVISLDRLVAAADKAAVPAKGVALKNDPPAIFASDKPAILLYTDGKPQLARAAKGGLQFIVNANWPVFFQPEGGRYYLFNGVRWATATALAGPWSGVNQLPHEINHVLDDPKWADLKKAAAAPAHGRPDPAVFYSSLPAELIVFDGRPVYATIPGTELVYAKNTDADLFVYSRTNAYYFLAAGRWFRAASLGGPWSFVTPELPPDFSRIPRDSPAARVLASVPGTEEARDAVLLAQVPTTAIIDPRAAQQQAAVHYDGAPQFRSIEGTTLSYAVNTAERVIKVDNLYYLCLQGVWFFSSSPNGPWTTATSVPAAIYTIPPSSPVYPVTYVTQTTTTTGYVESSYTAGYYGTFIMGAAFGSIVACGSGYYYPPYYAYPPYGYPVYRPYAATYGVGSFYNPYTGAYGATRGVYGPAGGMTGAAGYNPYTGTYARAASAYGPYGSRSAGAAYNPYTGAGARAGVASGPGGTAAYAAARNPGTGTAGATRQMSGAYGQWGSSVVRRGGETAVTRHASGAGGSIGSAASGSGARVAAGSGARGSGAVGRTASGDLYAGRDGNVYRRSGGDWQRYDNGSWNSAATRAAQDRPVSGARPAAGSVGIPQGIDREASARDRGAMQSQRFNSFQRSGGFGGGGRSFGGRGGGGRRR
jgi:hypothetical protein